MFLSGRPRLFLLVSAYLLQASTVLFVAFCVLLGRVCYEQQYRDSSFHTNVTCAHERETRDQVAGSVEQHYRWFKEENKLAAMPHARVMLIAHRQKLPMQIR